MCTNMLLRAKATQIPAGSTGDFWVSDVLDTECIELVTNILIVSQIPSLLLGRKLEQPYSNGVIWYI